MTTASLRHTMNHRALVGLFRSSHRSCSVEKCVLKNFANFPGKQLCWSLFLIALQVEISSAKDCFYLFHLKIYNKQQWRVWTRRDLDRVQSKYFLKMYRSNRPEVFCKKGVVRNFTKFTGKHLCQSLFFNFIKKETLAQVFSCQFCEISKDTFVYRTHPVAASNDPILRIWYYGQTNARIELYS